VRNDAKIKIVTSGQKAQCAPDPRYPNGIDLDISHGVTRSCTFALPYPAKSIGGYVVECPTCGLRVGLSVAGRPDDPRSLKLGCKADPFVVGSNGDGPGVLRH
jgi:hypothetical protein